MVLIFNANENIEQSTVSYSTKDRIHLCIYMCYAPYQRKASLRMNESDAALNIFNEFQ